MTGSAGFIGSHLCEALLKRGDEVVGVDSMTDYYSLEQKLANLSRALEMGLRFEQIDLAYVRLNELLRDVDVVFHLAGQPGDSRIGTSIATYLERNLVATARLLETCLKSKPQRIVLASSSAVYGNVNGRIVKESDRLQPMTSYAFTKAASEELLRAYDERAGTASVSLRYFSVYGPRQRPDMLFAQLIESVHKRTEVALENLQSQLDAVYIDDAIAATIAAATRGPHSAYNVGTGNLISVGDVILELGRIADNEPVLATPPPSGPALEFEGLQTDLSLSNQNELYRRRARARAAHRVEFLRPSSAAANLTLARRELGFRPHVSLSDGLRRQFTAASHAHEGK